MAMTNPPDQTSRFPLHVHRLNGRHVVRQPQLGVLVEGEDAAAALRDAMAEVDRRVALYAELGEPLPRPAAPPPSAARTWLRPLVLVLLPTILIAAALREIPRNLTAMAPHLGSGVVHGAVGALDHARAQYAAMSADRKEELRRELAAMAGDFAPLLSALGTPACEAAPGPTRK
jgi:hypothetical protein